LAGSIGNRAMVKVGFTVDRIGLDRIIGPVNRPKDSRAVGRRGLTLTGRNLVKKRTRVVVVDGVCRGRSHLEHHVSEPTLEFAVDHFDIWRFHSRRYQVSIGYPAFRTGELIVPSTNTRPA